MLLPWVSGILICIGLIIAWQRSKKRNRSLNITYYVFLGISVLALIVIDRFFRGMLISLFSNTVHPGYFVAEIIIMIVLLIIRFIPKKGNLNFIVNHLLYIFAIPVILGTIDLVNAVRHPDCMGCPIYINDDPTREFNAIEGLRHVPLP